MAGVFFLIILFFILNQLIYGLFSKKFSWFSKKKMNLLYLYHLIFYGVYSWYASNNPSDSHNYYRVISSHQGGWWELFGTDTNFIHWLGFPFFQLGFNYDMLMLSFAWLGYLGFVYAYIFFREKIPLKYNFMGVDLLSLILFFPNMHFWTASLGKGAPIFLGLMMFTYAIIKPKDRLFALILSSVLIFQIRPHVFMFVAVGTALGYMSGKEKIPFWQKALVFFSMGTALILLQDTILGVMGLEASDNLIDEFQAVSEERAEDLSGAGSGVDMSSYPLPLKLFTFWFRPLFFDAPNILGLIVSAENLLYLLLFLKILKKNFVNFIKKAPAVVKMSFVIFFATSFAMTFVMSNLGIIMRQKSMVMYFLFFVIYYYLAQKKYERLLRIKRLRGKSKSREMAAEAVMP